MGVLAGHRSGLMSADLSSFRFIPGLATCRPAAGSMTCGSVRTSFPGGPAHIYELYPVGALDILEQNPREQQCEGGETQ